MLTPIAMTVNPAEKAYLLAEVNLTPYSFSKGGKKFRPKTFSGLHRYQVIFVNRGDRLAEFHRDMGDAEQYPMGGLRIPSLWEHTVAELQFIADDWRSKHAASMKDTLLGIQSQSTLTRDALALVEEVHKRRGRRPSVFGPAITVQR